MAERRVEESMVDWVYNGVAVWKKADPSTYLRLGDLARVRDIVLNANPR